MYLLLAEFGIYGQREDFLLSFLAFGEVAWLVAQGFVNLLKMQGERIVNGGGNAFGAKIFLEFAAVYQGVGEAKGVVVEDVIAVGCYIGWFDAVYFSKEFGIEGSLLSSLLKLFAEML